MSNKRYYWLKLNENFFEDDTVTWLEEQDNGKDYVIFYLKLCLKSISNEGYLVRYVGEKLIPYDINALSKLTNTSVDTVAVAMKTFLDIGLVTRLETGEIYMNQINEMIGNETESARRMRKKRTLDATKNERLEAPSHCANNVQKCDTEIEKEKELDIDKEIDKDISSGKAEPPIPYEEIMNYFNSKTKKNLKHTTGKTRALIKARWNEGFRLDDFKKVIDNKCFDWLVPGKKFSNGTLTSTYVRPSTIFGPKFEEYLNENQVKGASQRDTSEYDNFF
ncbi:conserved phage C-terminal domain-containing protein [Vagococcus lutrae]|uniref:conserved phage C-terminal domain-containing protein n=1 Tax=Vagococcus lutrae TaxID=81947 RepID=UPI00288F8A73|nr:conserved phage C-terminal domain-containing protein [Vagococcus lutrae]MDT2818683.1 conserved phage C-terminal domain-containing protein [Vagococcus lutrae]MDT2843750.1 conserved phage C-terminal domain-containing protein [Vagococcus lutrae]